MIEKQRWTENMEGMQGGRRRGFQPGMYHLWRDDIVAQRLLLTESIQPKRIDLHTTPASLLCTRLRHQCKACEGKEAWRVKTDRIGKAFG
jgi:hypothetical protein